MNRDHLPDPVRYLSCPRCTEAPGARCRASGGSGRVTDTHAARVDAWWSRSSAERNALAQAAAEGRL